ncbi:MAG TPA: hypothetical protein VHL09_17120 [Dehalococcoidia bacterium]|nr:hypothetical protein [Dehalococcoidia bacterium]
MRSISATLQAAIAARSRRPHVTVSAARRWGGVPTLAWELIAAGSEAPGPITLAQLGDGRIARGRIDAVGRFWIQVISSPGASSPWSAWPITLGSGASTAIALWAQGATLHAAWATATAIAAATKAGGKTLLLWDDGPDVRYAVRAAGSGAWGPPATALTLGGACTGLACHYSGDFNCLVTGSNLTGHKYLWQALFGDGYSQPIDTWSGLSDLLLADAGSAVSYHTPSLTLADTYRLVLCEDYAGRPPGSRLYGSHHQPGQDIINQLWREPIPFNSTAPGGAALAYTTGSSVYLATSSAVWRAPATPTAQVLTADVRRIATTIGLFSGQAEIELENHSGQYATLGTGANEQLTLGSELTISLGYRTPAGDEASEIPHVWLAGWEHRSDQPNRATRTLIARDAWRLLSRWTARRSFRWATGQANVYQLLSFVCARAGLPLTTENASPDLSDLSPAFAIYPGDSGLALVQRLLALVPDYLRMRPFGAVVGAISADDAPVWTWGATYPILSGRYRQAIRHFNHVQLHGNEVLGEAFDWTEIATATSRLQQIHDLNVGTIALAQSRADAYLRDETVEREADTITVPVHPGLEILDPIAVTDALAGLSATGRRVLGLTTLYDPGQGWYDQIITAGGA